MMLMQKLSSYLLGCSFLLNSFLCMSQSKFPDNVYQFIENPAILELNQEPGHVPLVAFNNSEKALANMRDTSQGYLSLNGVWKFCYSENPDAAPAGFFQPRFDDKKWGSIRVPGNWEMQGYGDPMFRNVAQPFKTNPPKVPHDYNPVGSYRTTFNLPADWNGKEVFLRMDGSTSATFVWLNGREVGFNKGAN
jgi:beta-galactosidase